MTTAQESLCVYEEPQSVIDNAKQLIASNLRMARAQFPSDFDVSPEADLATAHRILKQIGYDFMLKQMGSL